MSRVGTSTQNPWKGEGGTTPTVTGVGGTVSGTGGSRTFLLSQEEQGFRPTRGTVLRKGSMLRRTLFPSETERNDLCLSNQELIEIVGVEPSPKTKMVSTHR